MCIALPVLLWAVGVMDRCATVPGAALECRDRAPSENWARSECLAAHNRVPAFALRDATAHPAFAWCVWAGLVGQGDPQQMVQHFVSLPRDFIGLGQPVEAHGRVVKK